MKKLISLLLVILAIVSCSQKAIKEPDNLIPESKMIDILYDLALITAAKNTNSNVLVENNVKTMPYIYKKYNIDSTQFADSDVYYASYPTVYEGFYKEIQRKLDTIKTQLNRKRELKADSIANSRKKNPEKLKVAPVKAGKK
ncbi:DUF4296 domain-containing protein [Cellulophaga omnivescoria]|uniref:DUF4296 domain-containing protein n=1 Tax=Cellulophaga omnivescoria TaxID=1888890 RepID=UPI000985E21B|nr:DUF4296 domain-containing protein [Cellulophaga omnivescoria]WBU90347.1 DUF4296 domain-containing protein [Cellulophaga omnivescoria]WKB82466.1 DUF4296 domain-containing protein [Cellulophaga lytica]